MKENIFLPALAIWISGIAIGMSITLIIVRN